MEETALRIRLNLVVLFLGICASFLGAIAVGVSGFTGLSVAAILFAVFLAITMFLVQQWKWGVEMEEGADESEIE